jgi:hypothetical protein
MLYFIYTAKALNDAEESYDEFGSGRSFFQQERHAATTGGIDDGPHDQHSTSDTKPKPLPFGTGIGGGGGVLGLLRQAGHVVASSPKSQLTAAASDGDTESEQSHKCPHKAPTVVTQDGRVREAYTAGCVVDPNSGVVGMTVEAAGLRGLDGLFLTNVQRGNYLLGPQAVGPAFVICAGDIMFFAGLLHHFGIFCERFGFTPIVDVSHNQDGHGRVGTIDTSVDYMGFMSQRYARPVTTIGGTAVDDDQVG